MKFLMPKHGLAANAAARFPGDPAGAVSGSSRHVVG